MGLFNFLLASNDYLTGIFDGSKLEGEGYEYLIPIVKFFNQFLIPISITLLLAGTFISIFLAFMMIKQEDSSKKTALRSRLIGIVITVLIVTALIWLLAWLIANYPAIMGSIRENIDPK